MVVSSMLLGDLHSFLCALLLSLQIYIPYTVSFFSFFFVFMPSPSNTSYLSIARFVFVFLNIISISEVLFKVGLHIHTI